MAVALHEPLACIAGWLFILWRKPFDLGDRIEIEGVSGDVIDMRLFQFTLLEIGNWVHADQSTGRLVHLPNNKVFKSLVYNYSSGFEFIWNEIRICVTYESNWKKAEEVILNAAEDLTLEVQKKASFRLSDPTNKYVIKYGKLTPIVYREIADSGVLLTLRYLTEVRTRRGTTAEITRIVLEEFSKCPDVDFAYPTIRYYDNREEGKDDLKPPKK